MLFAGPDTSQETTFSNKPCFQLFNKFRKSGPRTDNILHAPVYSRERASDTPTRYVALGTDFPLEYGLIVKSAPIPEQISGLSHERYIKVFNTVARKHKKKYPIRYIDPRSSWCFQREGFRLFRILCQISHISHIEDPGGGAEAEPSQSGRW